MMYLSESLQRAIVCRNAIENFFLFCITGKEVPAWYFCDKKTQLLGTDSEFLNKFNSIKLIEFYFFFDHSSSSGPYPDGF